MQTQMQLHAASFRNCATCARWGGQREFEPFGTGVRVPLNAQGACLGGTFNGQRTGAGTSCATYVKWQALR